MGTLPFVKNVYAVCRNAHLLHFDHADAFPWKYWPIVREVNRLIQPIPEPTNGCISLI